MAKQIDDNRSSVKLAGKSEDGSLAILTEPLEDKSVKCLQLDLTIIKAATCNFSPNNKLGEGGFGAVYKGILEGGLEIAVKRLLKNPEAGVIEFRAEVILLAKLQHKNLVQLLGFCDDSKEKILVYEFLPNLSLDRFLFDPSRNTSLDWKTRFMIIQGIARGLLYLHEDSRLKIVHRDLKTANILLDESMNPKIADFGLAKLFNDDTTRQMTETIMGTLGYMAPEYVNDGQYSMKSDVYSFGVILLEIVSGQKVWQRHIEEGLLHRAWRLWCEDRVIDLMDPTLGNCYEMKQVKKCIHIAILSIQEDAARRPTMTTIGVALNGDVYNLAMPEIPLGFYKLQKQTWDMELMID